MICAGSYDASGGHGKRLRIFYASTWKAKTILEGRIFHSGGETNVQLWMPIKAFGANLDTFTNFAPLRVAGLYDAALAPATDKYLKEVIDSYLGAEYI